MKTATITSITPDGDFDTANGHMWAFIVEFDDGEVGQANSKKATPPYRIGDSVGYDITGQTPRGTNKFKIDRKFGQTTGTAAAPQQARQGFNTVSNQQPAQAGATDERAFHGTMKKLSLFWCHCFDYAGRIERRLAESDHGIMTADQKQALVASLWIAGRDAGLAQHPPALNTPANPEPVPQQQAAPAPVHRAQRQNVAEAVPASGGDDDDVPF